MSDHVVCPHCGKHLAKGSTFCINCGNRVPENLRTLTTQADSLAWDEPVTVTSPQTEEPTTEVTDLISETSKPTEDEVIELPPVELSWDDAETPVETSAPPAKPIEPQLDSPPLRPIDDTIKVEKDSELSWDDVESPGEVTEPAPVPETTLGTPPLRPMDDTIKTERPDLSWEEPVIEPDTTMEGEPFKEIEPPKVYSEEDLEPPDVVEGLETTTDDAITHLFPEGCSDTNPDFIDAVVGEATKITISTPMPELETPSCPSCGAALTGDDFEYPPYVYSAMGKARLDHGIELMNENQPQDAIESFERAKLLFEKADDERMIEITIRKIDEGYDGMGHAHFELGERHLKSGEFEWAIVQFRKAREIYMLSTDKKLRVKCAEIIRICYLAWGKSLEDEADRLSKEGDVRTALERYRQAAEKYRDGGDNKRLKGLEKKIRKA